MQEGMPFTCQNVDAQSNDSFDKNHFGMNDDFDNGAKKFYDGALKERSSKDSNLIENDNIFRKNSSNTQMVPQSSIFNEGLKVSERQIEKYGENWHQNI